MTSDKAAHDLQPAHPGRRATLTALATLLGAGAAAAQDGRRAIQIYVAAPPGGLPDIVARHFAQRLTGPAGATVVVENRPGGGGLVAVAQFMRSAPDGQALLLGHSGLLTINPHLYARLPYDAAHDLLPVAPAAQTAFGLAVGPAVPASVRNVADFTAWVRTQGGRVNFGSPGVGTAPHLMGMLLARRGGYQADHVPYLGGPPAMADLVGGRIPALVLPDGLLRQLHLGGRLRVLATSGPQPNPGLPGVPTLAASGHPELVLLEWFGFFLPRGATAALVDSVAAAFRAAATPELGERLDEIGMQTFSASPAELAARLRRDRESWREAAAASGVRIE